MNFCQFWNRINGEPYKDVPPPVNYKLSDYTSQITSSPLNNVEGSGGYQLRPIADEDQARYAADDVVSYYGMWHGGKNPLALGGPMSDEEFKRHYGHTW